MPDEFHLMPDKFHYMPDKFHLMPDPTNSKVNYLTNSDELAE
jgi:hypothetical protein